MNDPARATGSNDPHPNSPAPAAQPAFSTDRVLVQITAQNLVHLLAWTRRVLSWLTLGYVASLAIALLMLERWGERNWVAGVFLYAPPQIVLVPLFFLTPVCMLLRRRLLWWHAGAFLFVLFGFMNFRWSWRTRPSADAITAVTFNAGESNRWQFQDFIDWEKPDIVFLQDTGGRGPAIAARLPGTSMVNLGQFCFISRYPMTKTSLVQSVTSHGQPVAARCEVTIAGRPTALYSVHLPTPRSELSRFLGGRRILGDLVGRPHREAGFGDYREWLADRMELARGLARVFAEEPLPMIVGGDFNTPDHGYIYHLFAGEMTDAFAHAGRGWGFTFPGSTHNPLSFYGPWLRIDYFFAGRGWKVVECRPEPGQKSQHKSVLARFEPISTH